MRESDLLKQKDTVAVSPIEVTVPFRVAEVELTLLGSSVTASGANAVVKSFTSPYAQS